MISFSDGCITEKASYYAAITIMPVNKVTESYKINYYPNIINFSGKFKDVTAVTAEDAVAAQNVSSLTLSFNREYISDYPDITLYENDLAFINGVFYKLKKGFYSNILLWIDDTLKVSK